MNFLQKFLIFSVLLFAMAANAQNSNPTCALKKAQAEMLSGLKTLMTDYSMNLIINMITN